MRRLTQRDEFGNAEIIALSDVMPELYAELSFSETNALTDALNKLVDYEDKEENSNQSTADVQEVVRCKDCVYCQMTYEPKTKISRQVCGYVGYNPVQSSEVTDYDFCSHGAKMEKE